MSKVIKSDFNYRSPLIPLNLDAVQYIIPHHISWARATPQQIHNDVLTDPKKKLWSGFPYNEYITKDGTVYIGRGDFIGAHCENMNSISYGIACEGDYDIEMIMPKAQFESLIERIRYNSGRFKNYRCTAPHRKFSNTSCPGKYFPIAEVLKRIEVRNLTLQEAIKLLADEKVINNTEFRQKVCDTVMFEKEFVIAAATKIQELKNKLEG